MYTYVGLCISACMYVYMYEGMCVGMYSQTSLIRTPLIRMPQNPNTVPGNLCFLFTMIQ